MSVCISGGIVHDEMTEQREAMFECFFVVVFVLVLVPMSLILTITLYYPD